MINHFKIDKTSRVAIYEQIYNSVIELIHSDALKSGDKLPSINEISRYLSIAKETVVKAFKQLKSEGLIESIHGKGFFISSTDTRVKHHVFMLFDTLSAYKEAMYEEIKNSFGQDAILDIYFHHFNIRTFENLILENIGKYTSYIVLPFENQRINEILNHIPNGRLYLLDRHPKVYRNTYIGVYQDFDSDIFNALESAGGSKKPYSVYRLIFRNTITEPPAELKSGLVRFGEKYNKVVHISEKPVSENIKKGEAYIVIDDEDLVNLVLVAKEKGLTPGKDIGIISYNDTSLKKVVGNGISVISTDFKQMGRTIVKMIKDSKQEAIKNPCSFIDRGSY